MDNMSLSRSFFFVCLFFFFFFPRLARRELAEMKAQYAQEISAAHMQITDFQKTVEDTLRRAEEVSGSGLLFSRCLFIFCGRGLLQQSWTVNLQAIRCHF